MFVDLFVGCLKMIEKSGKPNAMNQCKTSGSKPPSVEEGFLFGARNTLESWKQPIPIIPLEIPIITLNKFLSPILPYCNPFTSPHHPYPLAKSTCLTILSSCLPWFSHELPGRNSLIHQDFTLVFFSNFPHGSDLHGGPAPRISPVKHPRPATILVASVLGSSRRQARWTQPRCW